MAECKFSYIFGEGPLRSLDHPARRNPHPLPTRGAAPNLPASPTHPPDALEPPCCQGAVTIRDRRR